MIAEELKVKSYISRSLYKTQRVLKVKPIVSDNRAGRCYNDYFMLSINELDKNTDLPPTKDWITTAKETGS